MGRFIVMDPLFSNLGHYPTQHITLARGLERMGIPYTFALPSDAGVALKGAVEFLPLFDPYIRSRISQDPYSYLLDDYATWSGMITRDLCNLPQELLSPENTILYFMDNIRIGGLLDWLQLVPPAIRPRVAICFLFSSGIENHDISLNAMLTRMAFNRLVDEPLPQLKLVTGPSIGLAREYELLTRLPVAALPGAIATEWSDVPVVERPAGAPFRIVSMGVARTEKGFDHLVTVVRDLLSRRTDVEVVFQSSAFFKMPDMSEVFQQLSAEHPNFTFIDKYLPMDDYFRVLHDADLALVAYDPSRWRNVHSNFFLEAMAFGVPTLVPANSVMDDLMQGCHRHGETFDTWEPASITAAVERTIARRDELRANRQRVAQEWRDYHNTPNFIRGVIDLVQSD